jgi:predicted RNA polymerase sigma factor
VQEALIAAAAQWPAGGVPANPRGWLYHVALRRLTDHLRSEMARRRREDAVATTLWAGWAFVPAPDAEVAVERDDTLLLLFMCCHPALTPPSAIALTLRAVGGLTTAEIAAAFLVPEATLAQRISRAKQSIRRSGVPFRMPSADERAERLTAVLHVLYLSSTRATRAAAARRCTAPISRTRRSASRERCTRCCRTTPRSRGCSRSCCSPTRAAPRAPTRTAR